ncbi:MAG: transposase [Desulfobacteraceae bacterium]
MPRKARIDAPGALHHIIIRGIEKKPTFRDNQDKRNFLERFGRVILETSTKCYGWALLTNHVHLVLRTGLAPIATVMRRVLTGYAQQFNRRHKRYGHLFQNRYKSILCEEDPYFLELVRYVHLNPIRTGLVKSLKGLRRYPFTGHGVLVGNYKHEWQDTDYVLKFFGKTEKKAREAYVSFVAKGVEQGRRTDLTGGGLLRSVGGWSALMGLRSEHTRVKGDERILGSSEFVQDALQKANEQFERRTLLRTKGTDLQELVSKVSSHYEINPEDLKTKSKSPLIVRARSVYCYLAVRELDFSGATVARMLNISASAVSKAVVRGRDILRKSGLKKTLLES